ncbi:hypothetical protein [Roseobacter sp.]|nr:hypothetical protein [Roseobacter sp.]MDW3181003.1 hypothetical protein [Roseobacter sp.]
MRCDLFSPDTGAREGEQSVIRMGEAAHGAILPGESLFSAETV